MSKFTSTHDGRKTLSIDGTGALPSVDYNVAENICSFIETNVMQQGKIIDFGAGKGYFQKYCEDNTLFKVWSIEGCSDVEFVANKDNQLIKNLGLPLEEEYRDSFDLVVSFECIEHIHKSEQRVFWENLFLCAPKALVTIHTENEEHDEHCFIRRYDWWENFFKESGYGFNILGTAHQPWSVWPEANCSLAVLLWKPEAVVYE
tara:strand:+ start:1751 stop:2359 length:609 start_codon:yes stop_codon:yes gene_type:complete